MNKLEYGAEGVA